MQDGKPFQPSFTAPSPTAALAASAAIAAPSGRASAPVPMRTSGRSALLQRFRERMPSGRDVRKRLRPGAEVVM